jgi:hypothetical protein
MAIRRGGKPGYTGPLGRQWTAEEEAIRAESAAIPKERIDELMAAEKGLSLVGAIRRLTPEGEGR